MYRSDGGVRKRPFKEEDISNEYVAVATRHVSQNLLSCTEGDNVRRRLVTNAATPCSPPRSLRLSRIFPELLPTRSQPRLAGATHLIRSRIMVTIYTSLNVRCLSSVELLGSMTTAAESTGPCRQVSAHTKTRQWSNCRRHRPVIHILWTLPKQYRFRIQGTEAVSSNFRLCFLSGTCSAHETLLPKEIVTLKSREAALSLLGDPARLDKTWGAQYLFDTWT